MNRYAKNKQNLWFNGLEESIESTEVKGYLCARNAKNLHKTLSQSGRPFKKITTSFGKNKKNKVTEWLFTMF